MSVFLDIRSVSLLAGLNSITLAAIMAYISMSRRTYPGFHYWTLGFVFGGLGMALVSMRHLAPDWLSILVANCSTIAFAVFLSHGLSVFLETHRRLWLPGIIFAAAMTAMTYYTYRQPSVTARIVVVSLAVGVMLFNALLVLVQNARPRLGGNNTLLTVVLAFMAIWSLARAVITPRFEGHIDEFLSAGTLQGISFIVYSLGCGLIMGGLIALNAQRMEKELDSADQNIKTLARLVPICAACKKVRDDQGYWNQIESYLQRNTDLDFSHGLCPECMDAMYGDQNWYKKGKQKGKFD